MKAATKRFCIVLKHYEIDELKAKASSLNMSASDFIRSRIFNKQTKAKEQQVISMIASINRMKTILQDLVPYIQSYKSIDLYAFELLYAIDEKLSEIKDDL